LDFNPKYVIDYVYHPIILYMTSYTRIIWGIKIRSIKKILKKHRRIIVLSILLTLLLSSMGTVLAKPSLKTFTKIHKITVQVWVENGHLWIKIQLPNGNTLLVDPLISPTGASDGGRDDDGIPYNDPEGGG